MLKITNLLLKDEAEARGWKFEIIDSFAGLVRYHLPDGRTVACGSCLTPFVSGVAVRIAEDKLASNKLAEEIGVPTPASLNYGEAEELEEFLTKHKPIVIKPLDSAHGHGITINVTTMEEAKKATEAAHEYSKRVFAQEQVTGIDYRVLIIDYKLAAAVIRRPAMVFGDGKSTIKELIDIENTSKDRIAEYQPGRNYYLIDKDAALRYLGDKIHDIPANEEPVVVVGTANIGTGGTAVDVTNTVPRAMVDWAIKLAKHVDMPLAGVDFMGGADKFWFLEINASPSFGLHVYPTEGESRPVAKMFLDWLEATV